MFSGVNDWREGVRARRVGGCWCWCWCWGSSLTRGSRTGVLICVGVNECTRARPTRNARAHAHARACTHIKALCGSFMTRFPCEPKSSQQTHRTVAVFLMVCPGCLNGLQHEYGCSQARDRGTHPGLHPRKGCRLCSNAQVFPLGCSVAWARSIDWLEGCSLACVC